MFKKSLLVIILILLLFLLPQAILRLYFGKSILSSLDDVENKEFVVVFGAKVYADGTLSPIVTQRILAAIELFKQDKIKKIYISGTNESNNEVIVLKQFAIDHGVPEDKIISDFFGFDTNDTCKHFSRLGYNEAIFLTQRFHLPRSLYMCKNQGVTGLGVAVNELGLIPADQTKFFTKMYIRAGRFLRESTLTWSYILGLYDHISSQAEDLSIKAKSILSMTKLQPDEYTATLEYNREAKKISQWKNGGGEIIINGGYFEADFSPSGYLVVNGERIGDNMFDRDKSGLLVIKDGKILIRDTIVQPVTSTEHFQFAMQSFPFIIKNNQPGIKSNSDKKARRTAVGIDNDDVVYLITANSDISLYEFMNYLLSLEIAFINVLNLDGGPSTGIYSNWNNTNFLYDSMSPVPSVIRFQYLQSK
ncbi:MAG: phosphodiester glycosidase family protein [Candidatus Magasanikbacteria bacterium]